MNNSLKVTISDLPPPPAGKNGWPWTEGSPSLNDTSTNDFRLPKISIVTPSYNQGQYLEKTIRSVLLQGYPKIEYILIDGASTDNSVELIEKYEQFLTSWVSENDHGQANAINKGFERASGEIYAWLNSDDYYLPGTLHKVAKEFIKNKDKHILVGGGSKVSIDGKVVSTPPIRAISFESIMNWMNGGNFMQPSCFFPRKAWLLCGPLREDLYYCLDVDLWLKMAKKYKFECTMDTFSHALIHPKAKTTEKRERMKVETALLIAQYGGFDIARSTLNNLADENHIFKKSMRFVLPNLIKKNVRYIYKSLKKMLNLFTYK